MRSTSLLVPPTVIDSSLAMSWTRQLPRRAITCMGASLLSGRSQSARSRASTAFHSSVSNRISTLNTACRAGIGYETRFHGTCFLVFILLA